MSSTGNMLDENTRRYYLDVMGIQCWQLIDTEVIDTSVRDTQIKTDDTSSQAINSEINWLQLEKNIHQCERCVLHQSRQQPIIGRGNNAAELMFVLLVPNDIDDASAMICSAESNDLLTRMLAAINISIDDTYITSLLKCRSVDMHTISPGEIQQCNNHLKQQVQLIQPRRIVALGEIAAQYLLHDKAPLDSLRERCNADNYQFESVPLFVTYSPDELLQRPENKRKAWSDLQALEKII